MAPVVSFTQWPGCIIFIELWAVAFWLWKGPHVMTYLLLSFTLQTDKSRTFLRWQPMKGKPSFAEEVCPLLCVLQGWVCTWWLAGRCRGHRAVPCHQRTGWRLCSRRRLHPCCPLHSILRHRLLTLPFREHPSVTFVLCAVPLPGPGRALCYLIKASSHPCVSSACSPVSLLLQEEESALWPLCHLLCPQDLLKPDLSPHYFANISPSGYNILIVKCFSGYSVVVLKLLGLRTL